MKASCRWIIPIWAAICIHMLVGCLPLDRVEVTSAGITAEATSPPPTSSPIPPTATKEPPLATCIPIMNATISSLPTGTATSISLLTPTLEVLSLEGIIASLEGLPIDAFFEESYRQILLRDPDRLFVNGLAGVYGVSNDRFSDPSIAYRDETARLEAAILEILRSYNYDVLTPDQQLSYDIYSWYLEDRIRGHQFMLYEMPVNSLTIWGVQNWLVDFMVNYQPIEDASDAEDYIARLAEIDTWTNQVIEGLQARAQAGITPPKFILEASIQQVEDHLGMQSDGTTIPEATALYSSFRTKISRIDSMDADEKQAWSQSARDEIEKTFIPAYLELQDYLSRLVLLANEEGGAWTLPDGTAYYAYALQHETSSQMTPEEVHQLGISELRRVQGELEDAALKLGYTQDEIEGRLAEESTLLRGAELRDEFERLIEMADEASKIKFNLYPQSDLVILQEPQGSLAYYLPPPLDGSGPGRFYVNLELPTPQYLLPALTFHETIPGHHLQGALTRELDIPTFRKDIEFNAYIEGWALYAERLAWEIGLYDGDPLGDLGRLQFEEMRALRLVVDTGVHALGWTLEEASEKVEGLTGSPITQDYLARFYVLPGQASGYTIGMLKILELRQRAMDQLGEAFDLREFHDVILGHGPMPLEILEKVVDAFIAARSDTD